ncbi:hypothetical protein BGW38_002204 [Lunasporangiospora selenospora]|uniref:Uncharacterized protein n=1 Tax=Lunasporangiospora selenospora TaxID=979761 RepID=A0A9P6FSD8_9FUNG|nr:hypothetical protein BGW38_002204 [Lunasporangiospora selenospora]
MATPATKVYVITGGNIGIGFQLARNILTSQTHARVVLGCRDKTRADNGVKSLQEFIDPATNNAVEHRPLDLASLKSVHAFADDLTKSFPDGIHTLVLNAGLMVHSRTMTEDNYEMNMQVNHLSQFLLTQLLLPLLRVGSEKTPGGEASVVCFISSTLHKPGTGRGKGPELTIENIDGSVEFEGMLIYRNTKLCQAICMHALAATLKDDRSVNVNAVCPGFVPTTDLKRDSGLATRLLMNNVLSKISAATTVEVAGTRVYHAISGENRAKNGIYFSEDAVSESSEESRDPEKQKIWWNWTCKSTGYENLCQA